MTHNSTQKPYFFLSYVANIDCNQLSVRNFLAGEQCVTRCPDQLPFLSRAVLRGTVGNCTCFGKCSVKRQRRLQFKLQNVLVAKNVARYSRLSRITAGVTLYTNWWAALYSLKFFNQTISCSYHIRNNLTDQIIKEEKKKKRILQAVVGINLSRTEGWENSYIFYSSIWYSL